MGLVPFPLPGCLLTSVLSEEASFRPLASVSAVAASITAHQLLSAAGLGIIDSLQVPIQRCVDVGVQWDAPQLLHAAQQTHHLGATKRKFLCYMYVKAWPLL